MYTPSDFSETIERVKKEKGFDTYLETIVHYVETETDFSYEYAMKLLNKHILDHVKNEAIKGKMLKKNIELITL